MQSRDLSKLRYYVEQFVDPTAEAWADFIAQIEHLQIPANQILVKTGDICPQVYFIESGIARHYYQYEDYEGTVWFSVEGDLLTEVQSFVSQSPAQHNILSITPLNVWAIEHQALQELYRNHHVWERFGRLTSEQYLIRIMRRSYDLLFKDARTRYWELVEQTPQLLQQVPLSLIAEYLGIAVETLSRIRSNKYGL